MSSILQNVQPAIPSDLVSVKDGGKVAGITEQTIWKKIRRGELNAWGLRRCYRVSISELLAPVNREPGRDGARFQSSPGTAGGREGA
jgi:hypothetical protein